MIDQANPQDLHLLANLIHFDSYVHRHLDYRPPLDWVGESPFYVLKDNEKITAALACPPDPPHVAWIRLFAVAHHAKISDAWEKLWQASLTQLRENQNLDWIAAIPLQTWFSELLVQEKFDLAHHILMLGWEGPKRSFQAINPEIHIRPMTLDDLNVVTAIDSKAFPPLWQISPAYITIAYHQASVATVAMFQDEVKGFQISTATSVGGHLARLAVEPASQGLGIGYALLSDLIHQFSRRGAQTITVNTQEDNYISLALYKKTGFEYTGEKYPVYQLAVR